MSLTVARVSSAAELAEAWAIRREVFIREQGVSTEEELDGLDEAATTHHVLARAGKAAVGTARLLVVGPGRVHIGRVAVHSDFRGQGVGALLMSALEDLARTEFADAKGQVRIELSAQENAIGFYRRLGYTIAPERYLDARIWHQDAHKVYATPPG